MHVHDLVDFVSDEAEIAGKSAAKYINNDLSDSTEINIFTDGKIRYTVSQRITDLTDVKVYFKVNNIYKNVNIKVTDGINTLLTKKRPKVSPGEMESVTLKNDHLKNVKELHFSLEVM